VGIFFFYIAKKVISLFNAITLSGKFQKPRGFHNQVMGFVLAPKVTSNSDWGVLASIENFAR
jgi:hypothetical protein